VLLPPEELAGLWETERPYLNTASYGLPPRPAFEALLTALEDWRHGRTSWEPWTLAVPAAREAFARIVGCAATDVAVGATVSELVGLVAAALPAGSRVLAPEGEFASVLFPFLARGDLDVEIVPLDRVAESVDARTTLVAISSVQSSDGTVTDVDALAEATRTNDALLLVDATQACGWATVRADAVDFLVCHGYKWLLSPRGTAFLTVRHERLDMLTPLHAGWWAGEDPYGSYYAPPFRLAEDARRLDTSPAWFSWIGTTPALELLERIGIERIGEHDLELANRFRAGLGLEPGASPIVSVEVPGSSERLERAGVAAAVRSDRLRVSFHLYNTEADVDATLDVLAS
jgi:selenocysteine lyase/cysteine desulfurase